MKKNKKVYVMVISDDDSDSNLGDYQDVNSEDEDSDASLNQSNHESEESSEEEVHSVCSGSDSKDEENNEQSDEEDKELSDSDSDSNSGDYQDVNSEDEDSNELLNQSNHASEESSETPSSAKRIFKTMDNQCDHESCSCRLVSLPSLQGIAFDAVSAVTLPILYDVISCHNLQNVKILTEKDFVEFVNQLLKESDEMIKKKGRFKDIRYEDIRIKNIRIENIRTKNIRIEDMLRRSLKKIFEELLKFRYGLFYVSLESMPGKMLDFDPYEHCVWHSNGSIDYQNTILNLLPAPSFSKWDVVRRFIVMCHFCMEKELKAFDLTLLLKKFYKHVKLRDHCLVYYWIMRLGKVLHKIPLLCFHSIHTEMVEKCMQIPDSWKLREMIFRSKPQNAFKYFWNRLRKDGDRISIARFFLDQDGQEYVHYDHNFEEIFLMMSGRQQRRLLSEVPDRIILYFCLNSVSPLWMEAAIWAWTHSKHNVTNEQFQTIVLDMFKKKRNDEEVMDVLIEIWQSAPNSLQNYVVEKANREIASRNKKAKDLVALKFFRKLLTAVDPKYRISKTALFRKLIGDPDLYRDVLELCLPNSIKMNENNKKLMYEHKFITLKNRLKFHIPDSKAYQEYVELFLLQSPFHLKSHFVQDKTAWSKLSDFIDDVYPSDKTYSASHLKKMFITSLVTDWDRNKEFGFKNEWTNIKKLLEFVFTREELKSFKQMFLENLARAYADESWLNLHFEQFDKFKELYENNFVKVVPWCLDYDGRAICKFKEVHLPVQVFYKRIFHMIVISYDDLHVDENFFDDVDKILRWYMTKEQVKIYKLSEIDRVDDLKILEENCKRIRNHDDECYLRKVLMWLFDGDEVAVNRLLKLKRLKVLR